MPTILAGPPASDRLGSTASTGAARPVANDSAAGAAGPAIAPTRDRAAGGDPAPPDARDDGDGLDDLAGRPTLAAVHRHWLAQHRDGRPPSRRELEPAGMAAALPNVLLADRLEDADGPILRFRLVGTGINAAYGMGELTRRTSRQTVAPRDHDRIMADVERVLATGRPNLRHRQVRRFTDGVPMVYCRLVLPLTPIDGELPCLLIAVDTMAARRERRPGSSP